MKISKLLVLFAALMLAPWGAGWAASYCSSYLTQLEYYEQDRKRLMACGFLVNDPFMTSSLDEQAAWCAEATDAELDERADKTGLLVMHCDGILHSFRIENYVEELQEIDLISAWHEKVKVEQVEGALREAILANPGKKTGAGFTPFPTAVLQEPACRLQGVRTTVALGAEPREAEYWLVTVAPPCQGDSDGSGGYNLPFWFVEGRQSHYRVLLAYRTSINIGIKISQHQGYPDIRTTHKLFDGAYRGNSAYTTWHYRDGAYRYADSECTNITRQIDSEPVFIKGCLKGEEWQ